MWGAKAWETLARIQCAGTRGKGAKIRLDSISSTLMPRPRVRADTSIARQPRVAAGGEVRIIAGEWRSRRIAFPEAPGLRPTPDRVRETLFNWLGHDLAGFRCLDLYAGSGVLGFEALSRGAEKVVLVESGTAVVRALEANATRLGVMTTDRLRIVRADALEFLRRASDALGRTADRTSGRTETRFDVVFLDPPFDDGVPSDVLALLPALLATGGCVYLESGRPAELLPSWRVTKSGRAGQVHFQLIRWEPV